MNYKKITTKTSEPVKKISTKHHSSDDEDLEDKPVVKKIVTKKKSMFKSSNLKQKLAAKNDLVQLLFNDIF